MKSINRQDRQDRQALEKVVSVGGDGYAWFQGLRRVSRDGFD